MRIQTVTLKYNIKQTLYLYLQRFRAAIRPSPTIHEQKFTIFFNTGLTTRYAPAIMRSIQYKPFEGREVEIPPCFREPPSLGVRYRRMLKWTFRGPCQPAACLIRQGRDADPLSGCTVCWYGVSGPIGQDEWHHGKSFPPHVLQGTWGVFFSPVSLRFPRLGTADQKRPDSRRNSS